jgi:hypothetical protein
VMYFPHLQNRLWAATREVYRCNIGTLDG